MTLRRTLTEGLAFRMIGSPGSYTTGAQLTKFVKLAGVGRRAVFICGNGELDGDFLVEVMEGTDANGAGAVELTDITSGKTFVNGTDEDRLGLIEVLDSQLDDGYDWIGLRVTSGAAGDSFFAAAAIGDLYEEPASNLTTDGVAWVVGGV